MRFFVDGEYKEILPDIKMMENIVDRLRGIFDAVEHFHHSHSDVEMFEFSYNTYARHTELWTITCMGKCVASGGIFGSYEESYEYDDYIFAIPENEEKIFQRAYENTVAYFENLLVLIAHSNVNKEDKDRFIETFNYKTESERNKL